MLRRSLIATFAAIALVATFATSAFAWPANVQGTPDIDANSMTGYYIWHNHAGWHLRTHGPDNEHDFTARLRTDGTFTDVDPVALENGDAVMEEGDKTLTIHFHTFGATDGVNFKIDGGNHLLFDLKVDGKHIDKDDIFLGRRGVHPRHNPFMVKR
jgi:hypothetical protein